MPLFYAYVPREDGTEPLGTANRLIIRNLKTARGAEKRAKTAFGEKKFRLFTFTNFYDNKTFRQLI